MANDLPHDLIESVAIGNIKSIAEQPAMLSNLAYSNIINNVNLSQQNAVANQQALNELGIAITGKAVNTVSSLSPGATIKPTLETIPTSTTPSNIAGKENDELV
jgi:hypothetical protein